MKENQQFRSKVEELVAQIPKGRIMTYGQIASLAGSPLAARIVGGIAHFGDPGLPWQRVVNKQGGLAVGYPGGRSAHKQHLEAEGIKFTGPDGNWHVDVQALLWWPEGFYAPQQVKKDDKKRNKPSNE